jgi:hypothetical protein
MKDYTTVGGQLKRGLGKFAKKICEGLGRVKLKFVGSMLYGLMKGQSVLISEIGRALEEGIALKKTVERLARNLKRFDGCGTITENYISIVKESIDEETIFILDPGEISKEYSRKQEKLCKVWDASKKRSVNGYKLVEIVALTHGTKLPVPVYTKVHSTKEEDVEKQSAENISALKYLDEHFGTIGIRIMDRGMDDINIYRQCMKSKYIVRAKSNRNVIYNGETVNIMELANRFKGKIGLNHTDKYGKRHNLKIWHVEVELPEMAGQPMTLIMVHGYDKKDPEPCLLLTNMDANGKQKSLRVLKVYLCRWRIEEYYRFKKVQFELENVRVLSLASIRTMNLLVSMLTGWLSLLAAKRGGSVLLDRIFAHARRIYDIPQFTLYAVADGIFNVLAKSVSGIAKLFSHTPQKHSPPLHTTAFGRRFPV